MDRRHSRKVAILSPITSITGGSTVPVVASFVLLEDNTSFILMEDDTSKVEMQ